MPKTITYIVSVASCLAVIASGAALGQTFDRDRTESVQERFDERRFDNPIRFRNFNVWPEISASVQLTDNLRASAVDEENDYIFTIRPAVRAVSDWANGNELTAEVSVTSRTFAENDDENHVDYTADAALDLRFAGPITLTTRGGYASLTELRTSPDASSDAREPTNINRSTLGAEISRTFNRLRLSARTDGTWLDFDDVQALAGGAIDQDERDRSVLSLGARADYALSPAWALFLTGSGNSRDYDVGGPTSRDSSGYRVGGGADFELGGYVRGEMALSYVEQDYDSTVFSGVSGLGVDVALEVFPTRLTTVTLGGRVAAEETTIVDATGYLTRNAEVQVDHELLRRFILTGRAFGSQDEYEGVDRSDLRWGLEAGGTFLLNRSVGLSARVSHFQQDSSGAQADANFTVNTLSFGVIFRPG